MKFVVVVKNGGDLGEVGRVITTYEADEVNPTYTARADDMTHLEIPEGVDHRAVAVSYDEETQEFTVSQDNDLLAQVIAAEANAAVTTALNDAKSFGENTVDDFTKENILMGITAAGKTGAVRKVMREVTDCLKGGSLYDALIESAAIAPVDYVPPFVTAERLLLYGNKVRTKLGKPTVASVAELPWAPPAPEPEEEP